MTNVLKINSKVCLNPDNCYNIESDIPIWLILILAGATALLVREIFINS